jgi:hypothetical protein
MAMHSPFGIGNLPLVELLRSIDDTPWHGFLVAESDDFVVLHQVSTRLDLDGYIVFRREDVQSISSDFSKLDMLQRALALKEQFPKPLRQLALGSMRELLVSAEAMFGVVVLTEELVDPDAVEVGALRMSTGEAYALRRLSPEAEWELGGRSYRYRDLTRVEFGTAYEQMLLAVAQQREQEAAQAAASGPEGEGG